MRNVNIYTISIEYSTLSTVRILHTSQYQNILLKIKPIHRAFQYMGMVLVSPPPLYPKSLLLSSYNTNRLLDSIENIHQLVQFYKHVTPQDPRLSSQWNTFCRSLYFFSFKPYLFYNYYLSFYLLRQILLEDMQKLRKQYREYFAFPLISVPCGHILNNVQYVNGQEADL